MRISLGLDLTPTSVGFGIIDLDTLEVIDYGVRLFEECRSIDNKQRRFKRLQRRALRRQKLRIKEMRRLVFTHIINENEFSRIDNIVSIKNKGLTERLSRNELANILINYAKHRGTSEYKYSILNDNTNYLKSNNLYISNVQEKRINYRGKNNIFLNNDYVKELRTILNNQDLDPKLNEEIIELIKRRRSYFEGPGDENRPSKYGRFKNEYDKAGNKIIHDLIIDKRGKCIVYEKEDRVPFDSYESQEFILLSYLNQYYNFNKTQKKDILNLYLMEDYLKLEKEYNIQNKSFFVNYNNVSRIVGRDLSNKVIDILINNLEYASRYNLLKNFLDEEKVKEVVNLSFDKFNYLSLKAIRENISKMYNEKITFYHIIRENASLENSYISSRYKRSISEALKVINALRKKYKIELIIATRSKDNDLFLRRLELDNSKLLKKYNLSILNKNDLIKLKLYDNQNNKLLDGTSINFNELFTQKYIIKEKIPYVTSFDYSLNNRYLDLKDSDTKIDVEGVNYYEKNALNMDYNICGFINDGGIDAFIKKRQIFFVKNRFDLRLSYDKYIIHAIDALIAVGLYSTEQFQGALRNKFNNNFKTPYNDEKFKAFLDRIRQIYENDQLDIKRYSFKVDRKYNRQISDELIKSTRMIDNEEYVIKKYRNIYEEEGISLTKMFSNNKSCNLLMYKNDYKTYEILKKCYDDYYSPNVKNVFLEYYKKTGEKLRKYSKKNNGPIIESVQYKAYVINSAIDISKKYNVENKRVVLLQPTPYRTDFYKNEKGIYQLINIKNYMIKNDKIDETKYESLLKKKNLTKEAFCFSLYRNEYFVIEKDNEKKYYRFIGISNEVKNQIECKLIDRKADGRLLPVISKDIRNIYKIEKGPTGVYKYVSKEKLKLSL